MEIVESRMVFEDQGSGNERYEEQANKVIEAVLVGRFRLVVVELLGIIAVCAHRMQSREQFLL
jgi:hypothetical protein